MIEENWLLFAATATMFVVWMWTVHMRLHELERALMKLQEKS